MTKKVYIVILNYNGWKDTIECLESVLKSDYVNYQIIVVDNDSPNDSMKYIINWAEGKQEVIYPDKSQLKYLSQPHEDKPLAYRVYNETEIYLNDFKEKVVVDNNGIIFIQSNKNKGFASGNNIGINYALSKDDFEYIWLLNNDTVIKKNTLSNLVKSFEQKSKTQRLAILGAVQYYYHDPRKIQAVAGGFNKWLGKFWNYDQLKISQNDIAYIYGASMLIRKNVFKEVGLLNEEYFMYYEEIDLAEKIKVHDYSMDVDMSIAIFHKHGGTTSTLDSDFRIYFLEKNKIVFYKKYYKFLVGIPILNVFRNMLKVSIKEKKVKWIYLKALQDGLFK